MARSLEESIDSHSARICFALKRLAKQSWGGLFDRFYSISKHWHFFQLAHLKDKWQGFWRENKYYLIFDIKLVKCPKSIIKSKKLFFRQVHTWIWRKQIMAGIYHVTSWCRSWHIREFGRELKVAHIDCSLAFVRYLCLTEKFLYISNIL